MAYYEAVADAAKIAESKTQLFRDALREKAEQRLLEKQKLGSDGEQAQGGARPVAYRIILDDGSSSYVESEDDALTASQHYGASVEPLYGTFQFGAPTPDAPAPSAVPERLIGTVPPLQALRQILADAADKATVRHRIAQTEWWRGHRDGLNAILSTIDGQMRQVVPERAAGDGELPDLRALAQAVVDSAGPRMIPVRRSVDADALDALATRLAQPRPAAAGEGDLHTAVLAYRTARRALDALNPEETPDDPGGEAYAAALRKAGERVDHAWRGVEAALGGAEIDDAPGRVDAGAVREALHSADDALAGASAALRCLASTGMSDTQAIITGARDQIRAALDAARDRAGEGSALGSEAAPPSTSTEPSP